jgi:uncharacterized protein
LSYPDNPLQPEILPPEPQATAPRVSQPSPSVEDPPWKFWDVLRIAVVTVIAIAMFSIVAMSLAAGTVGASRAAAADLARNPRIIVPAQFAAYLIVIAYMVALVRMRGRPFWQSVRWNWPGMAWAGYFALGVALAILVQSASALLPIPKTLPIDRYFRDTLGAYLMAAFGISIAPLVEELFFRGFLYPVLARRWGVASGIVFTAGLFALIHESQLAHAWAPLLLLFLVGLVLTGTRARTYSVGASFLIHVGYNATLFLMLYLASDHFRHLERIT